MAHIYSYRIWHWELLPVLPMPQLQMVYAECAHIAAHYGCDEKHLARLYSYPAGDFARYCEMLMQELERRGKATAASKRMLRTIAFDIMPELPFKGWHERKYLIQCIAILSEKHDNGKIIDEDWNTIKERYPDIVGFIESEVHHEQNIGSGKKPL